jgi:hypothetical protein
MRKLVLLVFAVALLTFGGLAPVAFANAGHGGGGYGHGGSGGHCGHDSCSP